MEICYIPSNMDGAGCYRCLFPADSLSMLGGHHTFMPQFSKTDETEKYLTIKWHADMFPRTADLYVFQMPTSRFWYAMMKQLQRDQKKVIVELDDDLRNLEEYNPAFKGTAPNAVGGPGDNNRIILDHFVRHADAVTVATPALKESYGQITKKPIHVLRNYLDWRMWRDVPSAQDRPNPRGRVRVGYLGTLQWHSADLSTLNPWFGEWIAANPGVDFVAAGDNTIHDFLGIPDGQRVTTDGVSFRHLELADILNFDIGIVPLQRNLFNESKSHLKGMEYAGAGIPCIATPSESYRDWWLSEHRGGRGAGLLAERPGDWIRHLDSLATDGTLRRSMGVAARGLAEKNTIQEHWQQWEEVYNGVLHPHGVLAE